MIPWVDTSIAIGMKRSSEASIPNFLCGSVGSLHIYIPNFRRLFGFISDFYILFTNNKPFRNSSITKSPESSSNAATLVQIVIFTCSVCYGNNGDTIYSSEVNNIGKRLDLKQWVSAWFTISVDDAFQINLSWFLWTLLITRRLLVLMLNTIIFSFTSGKSSVSQDLATRFPRLL